jgi:hypothetical protein
MIRLESAPPVERLVLCVECRLMPSLCVLFRPHTVTAWIPGLAQFFPLCRQFPVTAWIPGIRSYSAFCEGKRKEDLRAGCALIFNATSTSGSIFHD